MGVMGLSVFTLTACGGSSSEEDKIVDAMAELVCYITNEAEEIEDYTEMEKKFNDIAKGAGYEDFDALEDAADELTKDGEGNEDADKEAELDKKLVDAVKNECDLSEDELKEMGYIE